MKTRFTQILVSVVVSAGLGMSGCAYNSPQVVVAPGPPEEGFRLGAEDVIDVVVWRNPDLTRTDIVIRPDGKVSLPLIGDVEADGLTADQLAKNITERYREYKDNPAVSVSVKAVNSYKVYVLGEVKTPGKYPLQSYATVLQAISLAGGFTEFASENSIQVVRRVKTEDGKSKEIRIPVNYDSLLSESGAEYNFILRSGDTIVVP
ncbi:polysaccharide biosynthesis/export family protein [Candidatus Nitronereus thalassa]|uniref:Polysaccharide export protein n=1 Tax=Candidatus Nitronereus thalassa TaxID=3020898 RepID=A0ABU3K6L1_9BACT|nr:polysaccharide biosynthesis/export family protein [Candidatus Nitronereus thalassa]MDT7041992.1 polysaccharide export protein [Candidatus Nitronereus thalassa]